MISFIIKTSHILHISPFICSFFLSPQWFFSVKDFSATTWLRARKFSTKLDSDKLYCVTKTATYCLSVSLFLHFSFSPMKILTFFLSKISQQLLDLRFWNLFGTKLDSDELYCVTKTKQPHIAYQSFYLFIFLSPQWFFSVKYFSVITWLRALKFGK